MSERDEVAKKAHQISMMINPDSSDDDAESPPQNDLKIVSSTPDKPKVPFWVRYVICVEIKGQLIRAVFVLFL